MMFSENLQDFRVSFCWSFLSPCHRVIAHPRVPLSLFGCIISQEEDTTEIHPQGTRVSAEREQLQYTFSGLR